MRAAAVVDTLIQDSGQGGGPAAPGTASTVPATAAATSPRAWAWEKREGLVAIARRLRTRPLESPEMARSPESLCDPNLSASSWSEDRELKEWGALQPMQQLHPRLQQFQQLQQNQQKRGRSCCTSNSKHQRPGTVIFAIAQIIP